MCVSMCVCVRACVHVCEYMCMHVYVVTEGFLYNEGCGMYFILFCCLSFTV